MVSPTLPVSSDRFISHLRLGSLQERNRQWFLCCLAHEVLLPAPATCTGRTHQSADSSKIPQNGASWSSGQYPTHQNISVLSLTQKDPGSYGHLQHRHCTHVRREKTTWQQGRECVSSPSLQPGLAVAVPPGGQLAGTHRAKPQRVTAPRPPSREFTLNS